MLYTFILAGETGQMVIEIPEPEVMRFADEVAAGAGTLRYQVPDGPLLQWSAEDETAESPDSVAVRNVGTVVQMGGPITQITNAGRRGV
jgi:hypothetical protein